MRKLTLPVLLLAALGTTSAMAATMPAKPAIAIAAPARAAAIPTVTTGVIKVLSAKACTVTLDNKTVYHFASKCDFSKLKVGEKVAVTWTAKGKLDWGTKIAAAIV